MILYLKLYSEKDLAAFYYFNYSNPLQGFCIQFSVFRTGTTLSANGFDWILDRVRIETVERTLRAGSGTAKTEPGPS